MPRSRSRRPGKQRSSKGSVRLAYTMWGVLGTLLVTLGVLIGIVYVEEKPKDQYEVTPEPVAAKALPPKAKPAAKPKPTVKPKPAADQPNRDAKRLPLAVKDRQSEVLRKETDAAIKALEAMEGERKKIELRRAQLKELERKEEERKEEERKEEERKEEERKEEERKEEERQAAALSPEVQKIHNLIREATDAQQSSRSTGFRNHTSKALSKTLDEAWKLTRKLKGRDKPHQTNMRMFIHNSQAACHEVLAELADHRREQEIMKIRARMQGIAVLYYEKAVALEGDAIYDTGIPAKAWALHRIAVLSSKVAKHHSEVKASYAKFGKSYALANRIGNFQNKSNDASSRLKADYPDVKNQVGQFLWALGGTLPRGPR